MFKIWRLWRPQLFKVEGLLLFGHYIVSRFYFGHLRLLGVESPSLQLFSLGLRG